jgi:lipoyl(octanoyl) transferase
VNTDLTFFNLIVPCGITNKAVTSLQHELGKVMDMNVVAASISRNFGTVFSSQMLWIESLDDLFIPAVGFPMRIPRELKELHKSENDTSWA